MLKPKIRLHKKKLGLPPGTLVYRGEEPKGPVGIEIFDYNDRFLEEHKLDSIESCRNCRNKDTVTWINIDGVHDTRIVEEIGNLFEIHPLTLEDIVHTNQRPKMEEYSHYIYVVLQMMHYDHEAGELEAEQVSLIFGHGFVISFQESKKGDVFDPVRNRLREDRGRIRKTGADYLAYSLMDVIVDYYMDVLEGLGEHIEEVEDKVTTDPKPDHVRSINRLRRQTLLLRRSIWPLRYVITSLEKSGLSFMTSETALFLRDLYDHSIRTAELIESSREVLASMNELFVSTISNRLSEVMKFLTIISTFFLPLNFIAGVYGMNFNTEISPFNMPELNWVFGYPLVMGFMLTVAIGMFIFFRRKGWL